jgi:hypothetical protein
VSANAPGRSSIVGAHAGDPLRESLRAYRWLRRTDRNGSVIRWWVCGRTGETVVAMQWRSPKSFRRSRARRVVIESKAIQTVVGFVVGTLVAASVGLMASPPDLAPAPSVPRVAVAMAVELVPTSTESVPVTTPVPTGTPAPSPTADPTPRADTKRAAEPQQGPAPKPKPKPSPRPSPTETPAPPTQRTPSPTPDPTAVIAPTPTPSPGPTATPKPPKHEKPPKPPKPPH